MVTTAQIDKKELEDLQQIANPSINPHHARFGDAVWYDPKFTGTIVLGGVGGIGSWLALLLTRAGYKIACYDNDNIDETNMAGQLYPLDSIGQNKASTVADMCEGFGAERRPLPLGLFTNSSPGTSYMIASFDNMSARRLMFETWKKIETRKLFIDGRMLAEGGQVYFVTPETQDAYETQLFDDKDVKEQPCSMKATSHCGAHIASVMMSGFTNFIANEKLKIDAREVPFKLEFELPLLMWTTKTVKECHNLSTKIITTLDQS